MMASSLQMVILTPISRTLCARTHTEFAQVPSFCSRALPSIRARLVCVGYIEQHFAGWQLRSPVIVLDRVRE